MWLILPLVESSIGKREAGEVFLLPLLLCIDVPDGVCYNEATALAYSGKSIFPGGRMKQTAIVVGPFHLIQAILLEGRGYDMGRIFHVDTDDFVWGCQEKRTTCRRPNQFLPQAKLRPYFSAAKVWRRKDPGAAVAFPTEKAVAVGHSFHCSSLL